MTAVAVPTAPGAHAARPLTLATTVQQSLTMAWRGLLKVRRTPEQLIDVTVQPILFTLMFAYLFGGAIAGDVQHYLPTLIPGILVQTVITTSAVTGTQLREDMDKGVFDRFRSLPIARIAPLAGALVADVLRYVIATTLTLVMGFVIGWRPASFVGAVEAGLLVIVCAWAISWIFAYFGVIGRSASSVQGISFLVLFPLTFLSNAFVPASSLPSGLRAFVDVNPVTHVVTAARSLTMGTGASGDVLLAIVGAIAVVVVFAPFAVRAYMRKA
jgi:ABC-2 type transport system permease protein